MDEDSPREAVLSLVSELKQGVSNDKLLDLYQHGNLPGIESISAQTALVTLAETISSPSLVSQVVTGELQNSSGSLDQVGIKAFVKALEQTSLNVGSIIETTEVLDLGDDAIKNKFAKLVSEAQSYSLPKVRIK